MSGFGNVESTDYRHMAGDAAGILQGISTAQVALVSISEAFEIAFVTDGFMASLGKDGQGRQQVLGQSVHDVFPMLPLPQTEDLTPTMSAGGARVIQSAAVKINWTRNADGGWTGIIHDRQDAVVTDDQATGLDAVAGLASRQQLKACFQRMMADAKGAHSRPLAVLLDLDRFKEVNNTLGYSIGDALLQKVVGRLKRAIGRDAVLVRFGSDEFALLFSGLAAEVEDVAARIINMLDRPFMIDGHQVAIGVSIGLAETRPDETDLEPVFQRADLALNESKRSGLSRFTWFKDDMFLDLKKRRNLEMSLRKAILLEQFELAFQPQVDITRQVVTGFEALLRWNHPQLGRVPPSEFVAIAEKTGQIVEIGHWVLCEACNVACGWPDHISVAVNVSSVQFEQDGFFNLVKGALATSGLAPHRLELEITETMILQDEARAEALMRKLRALGVRISLDDFGTGYSSLSYLRKFTFDKVKIDQSFVRGATVGDNADEIVQAIASLGQTLGMEVLAEGVETVEQLNSIRDDGCALVQGYLLGQPLAQGDVSTFLEAPLPAFDKGPGPQFVPAIHNRSA